ncbi:MAG: glycosyltransferase family 2 protein [Candidatus Electrothrix sp. ATG2]|nr:glycosyltransferase family 2 protein [Candidatus Electrothrix sp. ATG2]
MVESTVILPVYNGGKYLQETIASILRQTYTNFELLIIDDGSTDNSATIIQSFGDPRICLLKNPERLKLSGALNRGMQEARANT